MQRLTKNLTINQYAYHYIFHNLFEFFKINFSSLYWSIFKICIDITMFKTILFIAEKWLLADDLEFLSWKNCRLMLTSVDQNAYQTLYNVHMVQSWNFFYWKKLDAISSSPNKSYHQNTQIRKRLILYSMGKKIIWIIWKEFI